MINKIFYFENEIIKNENIIYFHICLLNNWLEVVNDMINEIFNSFLINKIKYVFFFVLGEKNEKNISDINNLLNKNDKFYLRSFEENMKIYEKSTLNFLLQDCKNNLENCKILYLHSKGITKPDNINVYYWRKYMEYFVIHQNDICIKILNESDTCGVNYRKLPKKHYSGNFWWSNSNYIKNLDPLSTFEIILQNCKSSDHFWIDYLEPEMWICSKAHKCANLHTFYKNPYLESYLPEEYKDKINLEIIEINK